RVVVLFDIRTVVVEPLKHNVLAFELAQLIRLAVVSRKFEIRRLLADRRCRLRHGGTQKDSCRQRGSRQNSYHFTLLLVLKKPKLEYDMLFKNRRRQNLGKNDSLPSPRG